MSAPHATFDLAAAARREMIANGFNPEFPPEAEAQIAETAADPPVPIAGVPDLRHLAWSSIDNATSRDLDQIEVAERTTTGIRVLVGIADVDAEVPIGTPLDLHAASQTTTVYTGVKTFPMLPERLSTDISSLNENGDRYALVIEYTVKPDGDITGTSVYRALVRNRAQLTYEAVGPWLEGSAPPPPKVAAWPELAAQLKLQDEAGRLLHEARYRMGALVVDRTELRTSISDTGEVRGVELGRKNRAGELIEDFMVATNEVMARTLAEAGVSSIRRVVKSPERWPRIVELAAKSGFQLPAAADPVALNKFLMARKAADPAHYADISLSVIKLLGPGEYVLVKAGAEEPGHFTLAAHRYTHSTAPNRRFGDVVTQRLIKAAQGKKASPYTDDELSAIARNCTLKEDAARKVERAMKKRIAAVALAGRIGERFKAVVTGDTPKGVFVRIVDPPVDGRVMRGEQGLDVGDQIEVTLLATDPERGFIDFGRV